jgi:hypothetical protein
VPRKRIHPLPPMPFRVGDRVGPLYSSSADRFGEFVDYVKGLPTYCYVRYDGEAHPKRVAVRALRLVERSGNVL